MAATRRGAGGSPPWAGAASSTALRGHGAVIEGEVGIGYVLQPDCDLLPWLPGRRWGGLVNALAILLFVVNQRRR